MQNNDVFPKIALFLEFSPAFVLRLTATEIYFHCVKQNSLLKSSNFKDFAKIILPRDTILFYLGF